MYLLVGHKMRHVLRREAALSLNLSGESEQLIAEQVATGRYKSADEVIRKALYLLSLDADYREQQSRELRKEIQVGLDELERGEVIHYETTQALEDDIKTTGREILKQGRMQTG
jgi:antitoxin ParD1/3/4